MTSVMSTDTLHVQTSSSDVVQVDERNAVDQQAQLLAFDRQNHMGASDRLASNLQLAIAEEADAQMQDKRVVNSAVNIAENKHKMKVGLLHGRSESGCTAELTGIGTMP